TTLGEVKSSIEGDGGPNDDSLKASVASVARCLDGIEAKLVSIETIQGTTRDTLQKVIEKLDALKADNDSIEASLRRMEDKLAWFRRLHFAREPQGSPPADVRRRRRASF
ncbi:hypothetical protein FQN49_008662, partial [Arthroderma sp. PD_2]